MARKAARSISPADQVDTSAPAGTATPAAAPRKWKKRLLIVASSVSVIGLCIVIRGLMGDGLADAQVFNPFRSQAAQKENPKQTPAVQQAAASEPAAAQPAKGPQDVMAVVNGQEIRRDALASACAERFGEEVLEALVNKRLILHHCRNHNIDVTDPEIDAEIDRMAARFKIGRQQWLDMLQRERGINVEQYKRDILWPTLALRKLAAKDLVVSDQELQQAYE
jgi:hypothetical protein